ncbi:radical SAM protein [Clostridium thermobutyricum]|uniref:radical SAM protein n=1 Tax=Clostridium thermobutyricum TaxID=29372 RepID=UPI0029433539|nr:radical SAM protein [Clostridium thermobutyricum]
MRNYYSAPCFIDITTTKKCNLKCDYCSVSASPSNKNENELSLDDFKRIFKEMDSLNVHRVSLSGGEPFTRSDFFDILDEAVKYKFAKIINSNGTLITDLIAQRLSNYNFDRI